MINLYLAGDIDAEHKQAALCGYGDPQKTAHSKTAASADLAISRTDSRENSRAVERIEKHREAKNQGIKRKGD
tara:strand:- start:397 stop:615 length:219 start_codon:yes stop_codon:yes gene_type:complete